jgi:hypothetical protein
MTTRYKTLNSTYEVDGMRVRRVGGDADATPRFENDGLWHEARSIMHMNGGLVFIWTPDPTGVKRDATFTSAVVSVETVEDPHQREDEERS